MDRRWEILRCTCTAIVRIHGSVILRSNAYPRLTARTQDECPFISCGHETHGFQDILKSSKKQRNFPCQNSSQGNTKTVSTKPAVDQTKLPILGTPCQVSKARPNPAAPALSPLSPSNKAPTQNISNDALQSFNSKRRIQHLGYYFFGVERTGTGARGETDALT